MVDHVRPVNCIDGGHPEDRKLLSKTKPGEWDGIPIIDTEGKVFVKGVGLFRRAVSRI